MPVRCTRARVDLDGLGIEVDHEIAGLDHRLSMTLGAAHDGMDARHQLVLMERLGHVVVGAEAQAPDLVLDAGQAGKDQDRGLDLRDPQAAKHFEARHIRKIEIEKDNVVVVDFAEIDPFFTEVGRVDVETLGLEHQLDRLRSGTIIFDQQYAHASPFPRRAGLRSARPDGGPRKTPWDKLIRDCKRGMVNKT